MEKRKKGSSQNSQMRPVVERRKNSFELRTAELRTPPATDRQNSEACCSSEVISSPFQPSPSFSQNSSYSPQPPAKQLPKQPSNQPKPNLNSVRRPSPAKEKAVPKTREESSSSNSTNAPGSSHSKLQQRVATIKNKQRQEAMSSQNLRSKYKERKDPKKRKEKDRSAQSSRFVNVPEASVLSESIRDDISEDKDCMTARSATSMRTDPYALRIRDFAWHIQTFNLEHFKEEFDSLPVPLASECSSFYDPRNSLKNRYGNILCLDATRVVLRFGEKQLHSNYIHGNRVEYATLKNPFIITQGPLRRTLLDFWRLVWQENVQYIVMLCRHVENGKKKSCEYFTNTLNEASWFSWFKVTVREQKIEDGQVVVTQLDVEYSDNVRRVTHYQYLNWLDCRAVTDSHQVFQLLNHVRNSKFPVLIHCSAGIGRSGTLVALEMCLMDMINGKEINVPSVVKNLRLFRCQAVQTLDQYMSIYKLILQFGEENGCVMHEDVVGFYNMFNSYTRTLAG